jgi:hypothetical protein
MCYFRFQGLAASCVEADMFRVNKAKGKHCLIYSKVWCQYKEKGPYGKKRERARGKLAKCNFPQFLSIITVEVLRPLIILMASLMM